MKAFLKMMTAVAVAAASGTVMAQSQSFSATTYQFASLKQGFQTTERDWQEESMSSASSPASVERNTRASDSRADVVQALRDKMMKHALETGAVANAAVNASPFERNAAADPIAPIGRMSLAQQDAYYQAIEKDAKP